MRGFCGHNFGKHGVFFDGLRDSCGDLIGLQLIFFRQDGRCGLDDLFKNERFLLGEERIFDLEISGQVGVFARHDFLIHFAVVGLRDPR